MSSRTIVSTLPIIDKDYIRLVANTPKAEQLVNDRHEQLFDRHTKDYLAALKRDLRSLEKDTKDHDEEATRLRIAMRDQAPLILEIKRPLPPGMTAPKSGDSPSEHAAEPEDRATDRPVVGSRQSLGANCKCRFKYQNLMCLSHSSIAGVSPPQGRLKRVACL